MKGSRFDLFVLWKEKRQKNCMSPRGFAQSSAPHRSLTLDAGNELGEREDVSLRRHLCSISPIDFTTWPSISPRSLRLVLFFA